MERREGEISFVWVEEPNDQTAISLKHKRNVRPKKMEFLGWGSKSLIEFLESIGIDHSKKLSQYDVTAIVNEYVHKLNLFHPMKKKKIVCDERLHSLFGKKLVPRIKIYDLLESHFAENHDSSEDDLYSSEEYDEDIDRTCKRKKVSGSENKAPYQKKKSVETPTSCFAAIIPENIKLLYIKRSLVQELLKHPESFEDKLLGGYIRIKSDPNDFSQKYSHQLLPVTGVKNVPKNCVICEEILLQVPNMVNDIPICMLSDEDFSKEECEDLCRRVKDGLLKRPTVAEFEQKAQILHEDIIKHWLPRELAYLQKLIDRANEKGWRKELFEYLERRQLLQKPSEYTRLLQEVPKVIADALEPDATLQNPAQDANQLNSSSPTSILRDASHVSIDSEANQTLPSNSSKAAENKPVDLVKENDCIKEQIKEETSGGLPFLRSGNSVEFQWIEEVKHVPNVASSCQPMDLMGLDNKVTEVIDLSEDEFDNEESKNHEEICNDFDRKKWFYFDPQGQVQGPVSRNELKIWNDGGYFSPDFKIWEDGNSADKSILLTHMLLGMSH